MSIPRIAIARPVTMFMISGIIILLGGISLTRLPVDLLPDVSYPTVSVRVNYPGVGPQEIEQILTRPIEQAVGAVAGLEQINSTSAEGSTNVRLSFAWGTDLNEAMDDLRTRLDRVRGRLPEDADALTIFRQDSNAQPIMSLGIEGSYDRVTLREMAENQIGPRLERVNGVAAVTTSGGLRRQIHVQLSKEKVAALDLPVERIATLLRSENQNTPLGEVYQGDRTYLLRSQSQFQNLDEIRNLVLMTRGGVPIYMRDVAEVVDTTEDVRSLLRINGRPGVRLSVQKQSGTNTVQVAEGIRAEIERINLEMPNIKLNVLDDSSVYINRSIHSVQEHALIGADARHVDHLRVPPELPLDAHRLHGDSDFGGRHVRTALLRRLHAQHHDVWRPGVGDRHGRRRRHRRARERLSAHGAREGSRHGGDRGERRGLGSDRGIDPHPHRRLRAPAVPDRHLQHPLQAVVGCGDFLAADVAARGGDDRASSVRAPAETARRPWRNGRGWADACSRPARTSWRAWTITIASSSTPASPIVRW